MTGKPSTGTEVLLRSPERTDLPAMARFAAAIPLHDLLFLTRDIREHKVLAAWLDAQEAGDIFSLIAVVGRDVVAMIAGAADPLSWSPHVCDIRLLVAPPFRNQGIGRALLERAIIIACDRGASRLTARMTPDQVGAITLFEESGFVAEAILRNHVRGADRELHDLAVLAFDPSRESALRTAFGG